jgi:hypothetical protein
MGAQSANRGTKKKKKKKAAQDFSPNVPSAEQTMKRRNS